MAHRSSGVAKATALVKTPDGWRVEGAGFLVWGADLREVREWCHELWKPSDVERDAGLPAADSTR